MQSANRTIVRLLLAIVLGFLVIQLIGLAFGVVRQNDNPIEWPIGRLLTEIDHGNVSSAQLQGHRVDATVRNGPSATRVWAFGGDMAQVRQALHAKEIAYGERAASEEGSWMNAIGSLIIPIGLVVLAFLFIRKTTGSSGPGGIAAKIGQARTTFAINVPDRFSHLAGIDEAVSEMQDLVTFLKSPRELTRLGGRPPKGVLLVGPPGGGKTGLARALAGETGSAFFAISGSEFVEMFVGVGAARVRSLFEEGRKHAPCIIFIDEIDAMAKSRAGSAFGGGNDEREQTLNQLLVEMDGFTVNPGVIIVAATNRPETLDAAILRPGRFDRRVHVPQPDRAGREKILRLHVAKHGVKVAADLDYAAIIQGTHLGFSGADLENVVNEAALRAAKRGAAEVEARDFHEAIERVSAGAERRGLMVDDKTKRIVACHETGHVLVALSTPGADPVHKVSIVPRDNGALGLTWMFPEGDVVLQRRSQLLARITVLLGERAAEERHLDGDVTGGAADDLQRATEIARAMVTKFALDASLPPRAYGQTRDSFLGSDEIRDYGSRSGELIDTAIGDILRACHKRAQAILADNVRAFDALADALFNEETLDIGRIREIMAQAQPT